MFQQSIVACLLGLIIGYLAVQTGSLLPGMLYHLTHNSLMVLSVGLTAATLEKYPLLGYLLRNAPDGENYLCNGPTVVIAALAAAGILYWFRSLPYPKSPEETLEEAIRDHAGHVTAAGS